MVDYNRLLDECNEAAIEEIDDFQEFLDELKENISSADDEEWLVDSLDMINYYPVGIAYYLGARMQLLQIKEDKD